MDGWHCQVTVSQVWSTGQFVHLAPQPSSWPQILPEQSGSQVVAPPVPPVPPVPLPPVPPWLVDVVVAFPMPPWPVVVFVVGGPAQR